MSKTLELAQQLIARRAKRKTVHFFNLRQYTRRMSARAASAGGAVVRRRRPHEVDIHVGQRLRMRRTLLGLSQGELARQVGLTFQQIQKYERGANRVSASMLSRIAATLQAPVSEMFGEATPASGAIDEVAALLSEPGALELLRAYTQLPRGAPRATLVDFVKNLPGA